MRYHCHGTRAILFSCGGKHTLYNPAFWYTTREPAGSACVLTFPPLVNLWICAVATPGIIRHTVMMPSPGRISYHMITASNCQGTKSNFEDNKVAPNLPNAVYLSQKVAKCRPSARPTFLFQDKTITSC